MCVLTCARMLPPIGRPLERSAPEPALGGLRVCFGSGVGAFLVAAEIDREPLADCDDAIELVVVVRRAIDGPAGGRPCMSAPAVLPVRRKFTIRSRTCACRMEGALKYSPAAAVPVSTKMPEPMMAPIPSAVSDHGPRVLLSRCAGSSASKMSLSMDLQQRSWLADCGGATLFVSDCAKWPGLL